MQRCPLYLYRLSPLHTGALHCAPCRYLDRLGKLERFRRHTYCVTLTPYSADLWLGLMTVIEWPKVREAFNVLPLSISRSISLPEASIVSLPPLNLTVPTDDSRRVSKDLSEQEGADQPAFERDTLNVYLVVRS